MHLAVEEAFVKKVNDAPVTATGVVTKILPDDTEGVHHQRFVITVHSGHTVLVAHNLERAYRVPVRTGDKIEAHGSYVWNKYGGLIHNTHHDDESKHEDGWINFVGKKKSERFD